MDARERIRKAEEEIQRIEREIADICFKSEKLQKCSEILMSNALSKARKENKIARIQNWTVRHDRLIII